METTGLDPFKNKIITIQIRHAGRTTIWKEWEIGETRCIQSFFDFTEKIKRREVSFVGYNVLKFDTSFLDERLRRSGLMSNERWNIIHSWLHWIDLYQLLGDSYFKAKHWHSILAGKSQETENVQIPALYVGRKYDQIVEYIEKEMEGMEIVYERLKTQKTHRGA